MRQDAYVTNGVVRWVVNNNVPPQHCLDQLAAEGLAFDRTKTEAAREKDLRKLASQYRTARRQRTPAQIAEEHFELQAAFGRGTTVVNIITGERTRV